jgi:hypothetical protein
MKRAIIVISVGLVLILTTLVFSSGHDSRRTFLGNLQRMEIVIAEGEYVTEPGKLFSGHYEGRTTIPTKYPFILSVIVASTGIVMLVTEITSRKKDNGSA